MKLFAYIPSEMKSFDIQSLEEIQQETKVIATYGERVQTNMKKQQAMIADNVMRSSLRTGT